MKILLPRRFIWWSWGWVVFKTNWYEINNFKFDDMRVLCAGHFLNCVKYLFSEYGKTV